MVNDLYKEHRARMRERFLKEGLENFSEYDIVEFMLFYAIPRKDTKDLAHRLLSKYKTLANLLEADYEDLISQNGIGESTAVFLKMMPQLFRQYSLDKMPIRDLDADIDSVAQYMIKFYMTYTKEVVTIVLLNNKSNIISCEKIFEGTVNSSYISPRKIAEISFNKHASSFILFHNHPDGDVVPSDEDLYATTLLYNVFNQMNLPMIDHVLIAGDKYVCLLHEALTN